jgi:uncharacterized protein
MTITDRIYSSQTIDDPLAIEIIRSSVFDRLKGVDLAGWYEPYVPGTKISRYEHSIGVYLLLKKFKASREEQIAGLLHDVSHSAFSHCIDYILEEGSPEFHSHQDSVHEEFIRSSVLPQILLRYNIDMNTMLDDHRHILKERSIPDLCADRIDYSIRGALKYKEIDQSYASLLLDNLRTLDSKWVFLSYETANMFASMFERMNRIHYSGFTSAVMFQTVADVMKHALREKYITKEDLYTTDDVVIDTLKKYIPKDTRLSLLWDRMNAKVHVVNDPKTYESKVVIKSRITDPLFLDKNIVKRVSDRDPSWKKIIEKELLPKTYYLKFK